MIAEVSILAHHLIFKKCSAFNIESYEIEVNEYLALHNKYNLPKEPYKLLQNIRNYAATTFETVYKNDLVLHAKSRIRTLLRNILKERYSLLPDNIN